MTSELCANHNPPCCICGSSQSGAMPAVQKHVHVGLVSCTLQQNCEHMCRHNTVHALERVQGQAWGSAMQWFSIVIQKRCTSRTDRGIVHAVQEGIHTEHRVMQHSVSALRAYSDRGLNIPSSNRKMSRLVPPSTRVVTSTRFKKSLHSRQKKREGAYGTFCFMRSQHETEGS